MGRAADGRNCLSREWFCPAAGILSGDPGCPPASPRRSRSPGRNTPSGRLTPKHVALRTGPLRPPLLTSLFSQPRLPLPQGPCSVWPRGQGSRSSGVGTGARITCPSPWGAPSPAPPPHTGRNPGRAELRTSTANIPEDPEKPDGVLTTRMGGPGPGLGPFTWKAQASTRREGLQACRCPRRPTRAGSSERSASLEFTSSQEPPPQASSPESPVGSCPQPTQELNQGLPASCLGSEPRPGGWVGDLGPQQGLEVRAGLQLCI